MQKKIFAASLDLFDTLACDVSHKRGWCLRPCGNRMDDAAAEDGLPADQRPQAARDGFDFGQLRHGIVVQRPVGGSRRKRCARIFSLAASLNGAGMPRPSNQ